MRAALFATTILATAALIVPVRAQSICGTSEELEPNETVAELAERCGVTVDDLLQANEATEVETLQASQRLSIPLISEETKDNIAEATDDAAETANDAAENAGDWLTRARDAVKDAGERIEEGATAAGRSASDYLSQNPDLNQDIIRLGERIGLPGVASQPQRGPELVASAAGDGQVEISADGLPGNTEVNIGIRRPDGSIEVIDTATTGSDGSLSLEIAAPEPTASSEEIRFVVETADERVRLASDPYAAP